MGGRDVTLGCVKFEDSHRVPFSYAGMLSLRGAKRRSNLGLARSLTNEIAAIRSQ